MCTTTNLCIYNLHSRCNPTIEIMCTEEKQNHIRVIILNLHITYSYVSFSLLLVLDTLFYIVALSRLNKSSKVRSGETKAVLRISKVLKLSFRLVTYL